MPDKIEIEILPDGSLKITTDRISGPNHMNAEALLREVATLAGGTVTSKHKPGLQRHTHTHGGHTHQH